MPPPVAVSARCELPISFQATASTQIYTLSLHDALPISLQAAAEILDRARDSFLEIYPRLPAQDFPGAPDVGLAQDRKSTRLNSSHVENSYAVFCLKKKRARRRLRCHHRSGGGQQALLRR